MDKKQLQEGFKANPWHLVRPLKVGGASSFANYSSDSHIRMNKILFNTPVKDESSNISFWTFEKESTDSFIYKYSNTDFLKTYLANNNR